MWWLVRPLCAVWSVASNQCDWSEGRYSLTLLPEVIYVVLADEMKFTLAIPGNGAVVRWDRKRQRRNFHPHLLTSLSAFRVTERAVLLSRERAQFESPAITSSTLANSAKYRVSVSAPSCSSNHAPCGMQIGSPVQGFPRARRFSAFQVPNVHGNSFLIIALSYSSKSFLLESTSQISRAET